MRKRISVASCLAVCVTVLFAADEQRWNVKPGLWQFEYNVKYSGLPPQTEAMMKRCVRDKDLTKGWTQGHENCPWKVVKSTSSDLELHSTSCKAGDGSEVDLKFHAVDSEHVVATMHGTQNGATLDGNYTGKWLGSTCPADLK